MFVFVVLLDKHKTPAILFCYTSTLDNTDLVLELQLLSVEN